MLFTTSGEYHLVMFSQTLHMARLRSISSTSGTAGLPKSVRWLSLACLPYLLLCLGSPFLHTCTDGCLELAPSIASHDHCEPPSVAASPDSTRFVCAKASQERCGSCTWNRCTVAKVPIDVLPSSPRAVAQLTLLRTTVANSDLQLSTLPRAPPGT